MFAGVGGSLVPSGNGWAGIVFTHTDTGGRRDSRPVELTELNCDSPPEGVAYINPITQIRLTRWRGSGAHIRLSDHRYR